MKTRGSKKMRCLFIAAFVLAMSACGPQGFQELQSAHEPGGQDIPFREIDLPEPVLPDEPANPADPVPPRDPRDPLPPAPEPEPKPDRPAPTRPAPEPPEEKPEDDDRSAGERPVFKYTKKLEAKFGDKLNKGRAFSELSEEEKTKWTRIFDELKRVADISREVPKELLFIEKEKALELSEQFEKTGEISPIGAWTISVKGTAVTHGFPHAPCAEFQSELVRQAYKRANYDVTEDFNRKKGNALHRKSTALVTGLGRAVLKAGWSVWDASKYKPPVGAIMAHTVGTSPSHIYLAAGEDGYLIVDNAAPRGRDLRKIRKETVRRMYQTGVFYLPPGFIPEKWDP